MFDLEYYNMITDYGKVCVKIDKAYLGHLNNLNVNKYYSKKIFDDHLNTKQSLFFEYEAMRIAVGDDYDRWFWNNK
jgi:hypothetical protein